MIRIASVNVNGIRAAFRKGMAAWLESTQPDLLAIQEVRAETHDLEACLGDGWHILHDAALQKGRAGVAVASRRDGRAGAPLRHRTKLSPAATESAGRWLEVDVACGERTLTLVSTYVHSGEVETPKQIAKMHFLAAMAKRLQALGEQPLALVVGDFNVGHQTLDIKNWKGNVKNSGFLPTERAYLDRFFGAKGMRVPAADGSTVSGLGWIDVGRAWAGPVPGPYTWWSQRGQAFDNDTGWRIDYHAATPTLAATVARYQVDRAPSYQARWSDHAAVVVDYDL